MSPSSVVRARRTGLAEVAVLAVILVLGLTSLWQPFTWDQAVFALGADALDHGGTLYRDYWDFKQPAIFWFFQLAGRCFGLSEPGAHGFEIVWMLALAVLLQRSTRTWFTQASTAVWCPLLVVGLYFSLCDHWHLLQVEGLVGLPLCVAVRAQAFQPLQPVLPLTRGHRPAFAAGLAAGVVLVFKLALAPIVAVVWLLQAWHATRGAAGPAARARAMAAWLAIPVSAAALVLLAVAAHFALRGAWAEAWWTWTQFPLQVLGKFKGLPTGQLKRTAVWVVTAWWPLVLPAGVGFVQALRRPKDVLGHSLVAWLVAGVAVILLQRWSGYAYHFLLLLVPLGLLAARAIESALAAWGDAPLGNRIPFARALAVIAAIALFAGPIAAGARKVADTVRTGELWRPAAGRAALENRSGEYHYFIGLTDFLHEREALTGPIYVFGSPLVYWMSGRDPASSLPGGMNIFGPQQWAKIAADLVANRAAYVLIEDPAKQMLVDLRPGTDPVIEVIRTRYRKLVRIGAGVWFERIEADPGE
jgi:hypothetical protein